MFRKLIRRLSRKDLQRQGEVIERLTTIVKDLVPQTVITLGGHPIIFQGAGEILDQNLDRHDADIAAAIRVISDKIASLPIKIQRKTIVNGREAWEDEQNHPLLDVFRNPNPYLNHRELVIHICQSLLVFGNAYFVIIRLKKGGEISGLMHLQPGRVQLERDEKRGIPLYYRIDPANRNKTVSIDDMLHIKMYHFTDPFVGPNPLEPISAEARANYYATNHNLNFFKNGATLDMLFEDTGFSGIGDDPVKQDQFLKSFDARHKGTDNAHKRGLLPPGIKAIPMTHTMKDMEFATGIKLNREQIAIFLGVPPTELGIMEYASYANSLLEKKSFWESKLIPFKNLIEASIDNKIIHPLYGHDYRYYMDESNVAALQEDKLTQSNALSVLYRSDIIRRSEARQQLGYDTTPEDEIYYSEIRAANNPFLDQGNQDEEDISGGGDNSDAGKKLALPRHKIIITSPRDILRKKYGTRLTKYERAFAGKINGYLSKQKKRIIDNLHQVTGRGLNMSMLYFHCKDDIPPEESAGIFNLAGENTLLSQDIRPFIESVLENSGKESLADIGINYVFDVNNPWVQDEITRLFNRSKLINEQSFEVIKNLMVQAYEENWGLGKLESEIKNAYTGWIKGEAGKQSRAMTIARTEMNAVVSGGTNQAYMKEGIRKDWISSIDENTRESHIDLDNQEPVNADGYWTTINGYDIRYPGDPGAPPEEVVNCRCAIMPAMDQ